MSYNSINNEDSTILNDRDDENENLLKSSRPSISDPITLNENVTNQNIEVEVIDINKYKNKLKLNHDEDLSDFSKDIEINSAKGKGKNLKVSSPIHQPDDIIQSIPEEENILDTENGNENRIVERNEAVASWIAPSTSRLMNKKRVRSKSWCGPRLNEDNTIDIRLLRERLLRTQSHPKPAALKNFTRSQKLTLASLAIVDFMSFCSMSIMAPFFPREAKEKGMSEAVAGFVFSFYAFIMFISSPVFGKITPIVGARFLFVSGVFVTGACNLLFGVLEYIHKYELFTLFCFLIRGFEALGASAYSTASYVFVVNMFPNNISSVLGILETFVGLGMSVGPAIGGILYSVGGFGLPFYVLGVAMILIIPLNLFLMPVQEDLSIGNKTSSIMELIKVPAIIVTGLVIVVVSNTWAFLDPTLEPHLRQFNLSPEQVGLVFLLFSALYGIFSPIWGWLADRVNNQWYMMVYGLIFCTIGLLLLGPSPFLPFLKSSLMLNIIGLSIIGISVALTLLPTFQGVLTCSIEEGGCRDNIATYSVVAGIWSCMYSLGEVIGPSLGGILLKNYGFPICSTVMATLTFSLAIITFIFFAWKGNSKLASNSESISDTTNENWMLSNDAHTSESAANPNSDGFESDTNEDQPLLPNCSKDSSKDRRQLSRQSYGGFDNSKNTYCSNNKQNINFNNEKGNFNGNVIRSKELRNEKLENQQCLNIDRLEYLLNNGNVEKIELHEDTYHSHKTNVGKIYENTAFGNEETYSVRKNNLSNYYAQNKLVDFWHYSLDKIKYYSESRKEECLDSDLDRNQVTDVRGTVNLTSSGACEV